MPKLSRQGDTNQAGGAIQRGAATVFANGTAVGLHVSQLTPHAPFIGSHSTATTSSASPTVFCEGAQVLRVGSTNTCGHSIVTGSEDIFVP